MASYSTIEDPSNIPVRDLYSRVANINVNIAGTAAAISQLFTQVSDLQTDVAANTTAISTNTSDIANLQSATQDVYGIFKSGANEATVRLGNAGTTSQIIKANIGTEMYAPSSLVANGSFLALVIPVAGMYSIALSASFASPSGYSIKIVKFLLSSAYNATDYITSQQMWDHQTTTMSVCYQLFFDAGDVVIPRINVQDAQNNIIPGSPWAPSNDVTCTNFAMTICKLTHN